MSTCYTSLELVISASCDYSKFKYRAFFITSSGRKLHDSSPSNFPSNGKVVKSYRLDSSETVNRCTAAFLVYSPSGTLISISPIVAKVFSSNPVAERYTLASNSCATDTTDSNTQRVQITRRKNTPLTLTLAREPNGNFAYTWAYPDGDDTYYKTPLYDLDITNGSETERFQVVRFAPRNKAGKTSVAGLADLQTHKLTWYPAYELHSSNEAENGAWIVYDNFLIHDGPDTSDPRLPGSVMGSAGCLEVFGINGFSKFNAAMLRLGGVSSLHKVNAKITYLKARRPAFNEFEKY